jgi:branched-chain amino acid transport system ATP-binding protein
MGPNGAGKTTLFEMLSGHTPADGGRVQLLGKDVSRLPAHMRARAGLGRSFQDARLFPSLTVEETIAVAVADRVDAPGALHAAFALADVKDAELAMQADIDEVIQLLHLEPFRDKFTSELSTGSRRLVELGVIVAARPQVLLLDEPSAGIAQREAEALGPVLRQVQRHLQCSILIIEHDMPLMRSLADRLVAMDTGRVLIDGNPDVVLADPRVVASYLGSATLTDIAEQAGSDGSVPAVAGARAAPKRRAGTRATVNVASERSASRSRTRTTSRPPSAED